MKRALGLLATGVALVWGGAVAEGPSRPVDADPVMRVLDEWTTRVARELRLDDAPAPHRVVASLADSSGYTARASFGQLVSESPIEQRVGRVEVVVGDDALDSSRFVDPRTPRWARDEESPLRVLTVAREDGELALARDLWLGLDESYKKAIQRWRGKRAAREALAGDEPPPDWSPAPAVVALDLAAHPAIDPAALRQIAERASAALWEARGLTTGTVTVNAAYSRIRLATSEGTRIAQPESYVAVQAEASAINAAGLRVEDELQWVVRRVEDLPPLDEIVEQTGALGRNVLARAAAPVVEFYEGPVVFEERAAAELFRYLLPEEICGTPPAPEAGVSYASQTRGGPRIGRRLLPDGWSVVDDPSRVGEGLAGGYAYDREGVAAQRVELVEDGYVRDLLMSRVPRAELRRSNGHARGSVTREWEARPAVWEVRAPLNLAERAFRKATERARSRARAERILVVRRLSRGRPGQLPGPGAAVWRYPDGREEPIAALEFEHVDRRVLRSVAAAGGGTTTLAYLAAWDPDGASGIDRGLPTVLTAPRLLLVEDLELVYPGPRARPPSYPPP